ncbi:hypothetical protein [Shimia marina]|uniref:Uncharacterized protein n=1 Tax=Shimia marina TaxID=321267 RepID=A0A0P1FDS7_9RHOB|nr:hypothetical protein [Shimia marina]CUH52833.1 hypothetical protein SHM7688_02280 [Shimia marina]SFD88543.1 hypothetical protein SAMN04488037_10384 [Shimia marina]
MELFAIPEFISSVTLEASKVVAGALSVITAKPQNSFWSVVRDFQTLMGGGLAFFGVILIIIFGNRSLSKQLKDAADSEVTRVENEQVLDRQRHERELAAKRSAVEGAIFAEILTIRDFLNAEQNQARNYLNPEWRFIPIEAPGAEDNINPEEDLSLLLPTATYRFSIPDRDIVYRGLIKKIGALDHNTVKLVIEAYDHYYSFRSWLFENDCSQQESQNLVEIRPEEVRVLLGEIQTTIAQMNSVFANYSSAHQ